MIITGPSHSGKSSLANRLARSHPEVSVHELDDFLPEGNQMTDPTKLIEDAFSSLREAVSRALDTKGLCVAVTTFTIAPRRRRATYLRQHLEALIDVARTRNAKLEIVRIGSALSSVLGRQKLTGRLNQWLVLRIWLIEKRGAKETGLTALPLEAAYCRAKTILAASSK